MSGASLTFLGSGDTFGSGGRLQTCFHVDTGSTRFLLDCGASSLSAMKRHDIDRDAIDVIFVTHLHGDHFGGIPFFVLDAQLIAKRTAPLTIAGPPGIETRVREAMEVLFPGLSDVDQAFEIRFVELDEGEETALSQLRVMPYRVVHPSGAPPYALRVAFDEFALAYSGDTEWTESLIEVTRDTNLFICEAYFYEKRVPYHLDYVTLQAHRDELDCDRLIVTHMSEEMLARLPTLEVEYAEDGMELSL